MISKPSGLALSAMAFLCAAVLVACSSSPTLQFVTVAPTSGTIYVSAAPAGGVKGARRAVRPALNSTRRSAVTLRDITTASCGSLQFAATALFSNGTTQDESTTATWTSSNSAAATVDNTGLATGVALGTTNIAAFFNGVTATAAALEVDQLNTITMNPTSASIASGGSQTFMALGNFTLASGSSAQQDISTQVTWASSNTNVATVDSSGNITTVGQGTTNITATSCDGITVGTAVLNVAAPITLLITPSTTPNIATGTTIQFTVTGRSDGSAVTNPITWQSGTPTVATMDGGNFGIALGVSAGTSPVVITATESVTGYTGTAMLNVQAAAARYAYVSNIIGTTPAISSYTVNVSAGTFTHMTDANTGSAPQQVLLHPSGDLLYYVDSGNAMHSVKLDSTTGLLTATTFTPSVDSCSTTDASVGVIEPYGRFVYVVSLNGKCIFGYAITQPPVSTAGTLTLIPGFNATTGITDSVNLAAPTWVMTDRSGRYLYVVNNTIPGSITEYNIDQMTGALSLMSTPSVPAGNGTTNSPFFGTTDVNGHLFVANLGTTGTDPQTVSAYTITSTGTSPGQLQSVGADTVVTGATALVNVLTDPTGKYLYALDDNASGGAGQVFAFNLNSSTGVIGSQIGTAQPTGAGSTGMAIDPTGALLGIDNSVDGTISLFIVTSGVPGTPTTVTTGTNPAFEAFYNALSGQ